MILSADPHKNWMPMKCWKNQPSSTSVRALAHLSLRARSCSSSEAPQIAKISKGDLEAMPRVAQKQRNWNPESAVCARTPHTLCAPCVHGPVAHQLLHQMQNLQRETWKQCQGWLRNKKLSSWICCVCARAFISTFFFTKKRWRVNDPHGNGWSKSVFLENLSLGMKPKITGQLVHPLQQGCIFFPKIEFFINHYLEHRVFYK